MPRADLAAIEAPHLKVQLRSSPLISVEAHKPPASEANPNAGELVELYPSLKPTTEEYLATLSVRIFASQHRDLKRICRHFDIDKSAIVRDILTAGIAEILAKLDGDVTE